MTSETVKDTNAVEAEEMAKYGINRVPVDYFHYKQFRYTNLKDAIAQAERDRQRTFRTDRQKDPGQLPSSASAR